MPRCPQVNACRACTNRLLLSCRKLSDAETLLRMKDDLETRYRDHPALAEELCEGLRSDDGISSAELAAWTVLVSTIYNLDSTKTRE